MSKKTEQHDRAREELLKLLKPGDKVYTILRHVSRSGMSRVIDLCISDVPPHENAIRRISWLAADACGFRHHARMQGLTVSGCGMDMGFHLVYSLSRSLFPSGFECIGEGCPSNDHSNGDRDYTPHHHRDGGYALVQVWL